MTTAIQEYSATEAALSDLAHRYGSVVFDISTKTGLADAKKARAEIRGYRTSLEVKRVEIKSPALERCRLIDAEAKRITAELLKLETPIDDTIKAEERRKEAEDKARIEAIQAKLEAIKEAPAKAIGKAADAIEEDLTNYSALVINGSYDEFKDAAELARQASVAKLKELHAAAVAHEAEQERIKAEREELAQLKAEADKRAREEAEKEAARIRQRAAEEAESRRKIEDAERESRARIEAQEREARKAREADEARLKAERDKVEAERRSVEERQRKEQAEAEAKAKAERDAKEAQEREVMRKEAELMDARAMLVTFRDRFGNLTEFAAVTRAIVYYLKESEPKRKVA